VEGWLSNNPLNLSQFIIMDLPNFGNTGPIVYREGVYSVQARTAVAL
jgi:hypothetical protein